MENTNKQAIVPKLRFPGFRGDWHFEMLGKVLREHKRKNVDDCDVFSVSLEKGLVNQVDHLGRSFSARDTSNYNKVSPYDIVYTKSPLRDYPFGIVKQSKLKEDVAVSPLYGVFSLRNRHLGAIVEAYFDSPYRSIRFIEPLAQKGAKNTINITNPTFLSGSLAVPPSEKEQKKIASFLGTLNKLIGAHSTKLEALQDHKKGLLQQLFPSENKNIPVRRFPEFHKAKPWRKRKISSILKRVAIPVDVASEIEYQEIGVRSHGKGIFHKLPTTGKSIGEKRVFQVIENALVLNIVFAWEQAIATTSEHEIGMIASHRFPMYVSKHDDCDVRFIKLAFLTPQGKHLLGVASPGGAGRNRTLGQKEFWKLQIQLPEKDEQTKVADVILKTEKLITFQSDLINDLKKHKEGLMQQVFAYPDLSLA